jgi:hypothetical protein
MDTNEIVIKTAMVSIFSENAFVSRASRRECIRIFKLFRSVKAVLGSGLLSIRCFIAPMHSAGL